ncbi:hypothetical protein BX616_010355 [Lobosporangium transversale]|uniref:C2H2-type domain-containing protein n=1 Tax=Lobosporangium transversale TaxID=64571 RepID=A0A1Y2GR23_9FUNG|nr:hypothetical protein BCR41DRAFT_351040 [Lobosporangium transversale]KAF9912321.1 hypothetical protein BX616_010355 [Lobosporangium transversale]ORZ19957.1 hypothetical protein BCR41DRAFT_351040 [Lobosporangium transversale]|eukprot:XP_021882497.1 hypothetical protein BCR41DRAFT_351040 [Lobosporangium transversale]
MSHYTRQPIVSMQAVGMGFDNEEFAKYQPGYSLGHGAFNDGNYQHQHHPMVSNACEAIHPGTTTDVNYFSNGLSFQFPTPNDGVEQHSVIGNAKKSSLVSVPRGPNGLESISMSFEELTTAAITPATTAITTTPKNNRNVNIPNHSNYTNSSIRGSNSSSPISHSENNYNNNLVIHQYSTSSVDNYTISNNIGNNSNSSLLFTSSPYSSSSSSSSSPTSSLPIFAPIEALERTPAMIAAATGSSASSSVMGCMMTNQHYLLVQPDHQENQQNGQQQHLLQQQQQQTGTALKTNENYMNNNPTPSYVTFSSNGFQGIARNNNHSSDYSQFASWNIGVTAVSSAAQSTEAHLIVAPIKPSQPAITTTPTTPSGITWTNDTNMQTQNTAPTVDTANSITKSGMHSKSSSICGSDNAALQEGSTKQCQTQPVKQTGPHQQQLQIMTSFEPGFASIYPQQPNSSNNTTDNASTPSVGSVNNIHQLPPSMGSAQAQAQLQSQAQVHAYPWSPVESCLTSGSSTPSFASMSPSLSYSNTEHGGNSGGIWGGVSPCNSSRPNSPSFNTNNSSACTPTEGYVPERRIRRLENDFSNFIIRSRKSSTSSTSSNVSQRRMSTLRESTTNNNNNSNNSNINNSNSNSNSNRLSSPNPMSTSNSNSITAASTSTPVSTSSPTHQCSKCGQCFAGPAVLARHMESIHEKLLWNCVGCKSNLSRRDAVTRHINLSPMDSICREVGTIGQIKMINGTEIHYEVSSYRAKPLDEVMNRMGKKISTSLRREIDLAKARSHSDSNVNSVSSLVVNARSSISATAAAAAVAVTATSTTAATVSAAGDLLTSNGIYGSAGIAAAATTHEAGALIGMGLDFPVDYTQSYPISSLSIHTHQFEYGDEEDGLKKRRRMSQPALSQRKK